MGHRFFADRGDYLSARHFSEDAENAGAAEGRADTADSVYPVHCQKAVDQGARDDPEPEDVLMIEGVAGYNPEMEGIMVNATTITSKLLQQAKKTAAPAAAAES